jgi:hypothetical protein
MLEIPYFPFWSVFMVLSKQDFVGSHKNRNSLTVPPGAPTRGGRRTRSVVLWSSSSGCPCRRLATYMNSIIVTVVMVCERDTLLPYRLFDLGLYSWGYPQTPGKSYFATMGDFPSFLTPKSTNIHNFTHQVVARKV